MDKYNSHYSKTFTRIEFISIKYLINYLIKNHSNKKSKVTTCLVDESIAISI